MSNGHNEEAAPAPAETAPVPDHDHPAYELEDTSRIPNLAATTGVIMALPLDELMLQLKAWDLGPEALETARFQGVRVSTLTSGEQYPYLGRKASVGYHGISRP